MPLRTSDGRRRLVRFQSLSEYPVEVEEFDPELSAAHVGRRRRFTHPDPDDTQQLLDAWFAGLRRRVPYLQWADQLHGLVEHWSRQGCTLSDDYVRELEQWIRQCQSLAAQRETLLALKNDRRTHPTPSAVTIPISGPPGSGAASAPARRTVRIAPEMLSAVREDLRRQRNTGERATAESSVTRVELTAANETGSDLQPKEGDRRTIVVYRESRSVPGLLQVGSQRQEFHHGFGWWNRWKNQGAPFAFRDVDERGYAHIAGIQGAYVAGYRQPADPFLLGFGDLPDRRGGEGWPAFVDNPLGPVGAVIGASKVPRVPFTYPLPASGVVSAKNIGYVLESMRKAEELLRTQGRLNELQAQRNAIKRLESITKHLGWPLSPE